MSFILLFKDELKGYYKSKAMIILWIGMPILILIMHLLLVSQSPEAASFISFTDITVLLISQIGGMISSIMLSTSIVNEKNKNVYDLFLIRPVRRYEIILAKYCAILICLLIAVLISLIIGITIDLSVKHISMTIEFWKNNIESLLISLSLVSISCCLGLLFGISIKSVAAAAILSFYVGNQLSSVISIVVIYIGQSYKLLISSILGIGLTLTIMTINLILFNRKQF